MPNHRSKAKTFQAYLPETALLLFTYTLTSTGVWLAWKRKSLLK